MFQKIFVLALALVGLGSNSVFAANSGGIEGLWQIPAEANVPNPQDPFRDLSDFYFKFSSGKISMIVMIGLQNKQLPAGAYEVIDGENVAVQFEGEEKILFQYFIEEVGPFKTLNLCLPGTTDSTDLDDCLRFENDGKPPFLFSGTHEIPEIEAINISLDVAGASVHCQVEETKSLFPEKYDDFDGFLPLCVAPDVNGGYHLLSAYVVLFMHDASQVASYAYALHYKKINGDGVTTEESMAEVKTLSLGLNRSTIKTATGDVLINLEIRK